MSKTINGLTVTTSAAAGDFVPIWRAANGDTRKITKANFMGGVLTGGGTLATGGFTLTVGASSTINGSITGGGTVATGGFTGTLPASGTLALRDVAQTFSALQTFSAGVDVTSFLRLANNAQTISSGQITPANTFTIVDTEGAAASDDLETINGGSTGRIIILRAQDANRTVVIKNLTGNIRCPGDRGLTHTNDIWIGIYNGSAWSEISFSDNTA